ncbi:MAG: gliding motility protein GldM [Prevotellaceae bacterium]|jgi:gliding motility-associated protein GldM|nr:gliding motility protein GldM [Prevotellaceae bacterium]
MSGAKNCPETPRQKMIGMMYLVLTAMLALNVSADILNGFKLVNDSLSNTLKTAKVRNEGLYGDFKYLADQNPTKVGEWLKKSEIVKAKSDSLYQYIDKIKIDIAKIADGEEGNPDNLENAGNLDAAGQIGIVNGRGKVLRNLLASYSGTIVGLVDDPKMKEEFTKTFETKDKVVNGTKTPWEDQVFESMPAAAAVTILSKFQNDIKNSEARIIQYLIGQIDASDFRVNKIEAMVIPNSKYVIKGGKYSAKIVLAAIDSTKQPTITVGGKVIQNGLYEFGVGTVGTVNYSGTILLPKSDGTSQSYPFKSDYTVGEPSVTVSADLMNVFYAGFDNPVSISVPGVPQSQVNASCASGNLRRSGSGWLITPTKVGQDCVINVTATIDGKAQNFGGKTFRVKALPPPVGYIAYTDASGNPDKYKGSKPFAKAQLVGSKGVRAELDDADLDVKFRVLSFELTYFDSMGNSIILISDSQDFTDKQTQAIRGLSKGKQFFISRIKAVGPDRIERTLSPIQVLVN